MAKPIKPTPKLNKKESKAFVNQMIKEQENPNPKRIKTIKEAMKTKFSL